MDYTGEATFYWANLPGKPTNHEIDTFYWIRQVSFTLHKEYFPKEKYFPEAVLPNRGVSRISKSNIYEDIHKKYFNDQ
jgi:hypothetical protein